MPFRPLIDTGVDWCTSVATPLLYGFDVLPYLKVTPKLIVAVEIYSVSILPQSRGGVVHVIKKTSFDVRGQPREFIATHSVNILLEKCKKNVPVSFSGQRMRYKQRMLILP